MSTIDRIRKLIAECKTKIDDSADLRRAVAEYEDREQARDDRLRLTARSQTYVGVVADLESLVYLAEPEPDNAAASVRERALRDAAGAVRGWCGQGFPVDKKFYYNKSFAYIHLGVRAAGRNARRGPFRKRSSGRSKGVWDEKIAV